MTTLSDATAQHYLTPPIHSFWYWEEGETVTWADGTTIAFRPELITVLEHLESHGLPPFGALVLLMAACRDNWRQTPSETGSLYGLARILERFGDVSGRFNPSWLADLFTKLDIINGLPSELRCDPHGKSVIAEIVFEHARNRISQAQAAAVVDCMRSGDIPDGTSSEKMEQVFSVFLNDVKVLNAGLTNLNPATLELRVRTGLEHLVKEADNVRPIPETFRRLLKELEDDGELAAIAHIANRLLAVTHLPRQLQRTQEIPVGGVSDIANRGPLDRLLLSELAYDDLTLATRVANNEALYIRREAPPDLPDQQRVMLLDSGIRLWGTPRVFLTAAAMALAANSRSSEDVLVYRAAGGHASEVELHTRRGLISHLEVLEPDIHPAGALNAIATTIPADGKPVELLVLTHQHTLEEEPFLAALRDVDWAEVYVATVTTNGDFEILRMTSHGFLSERQTCLDLDRILIGDVNKPQSAVPSYRDPDLPMILSLRPFPLLLPVNLKPERTRCFVEHALALSRDRRLLYCRPEHGARELACDMPSGRVAALVEDDHQRCHAVVQDHQGKDTQLVSIDHSGASEPQVHLLQKMMPHLEHGIWLAGRLLLIAKQEVFVVNVNDGTVSERLPIPNGRSWRGGRFFAQGALMTSKLRAWYTLAHDGVNAGFERLPIAAEKGWPVAVFDRSGLDGPWMLAADGVIRSLASDVELAVSGRPSSITSVAQVSGDGHRLLVINGRGEHGIIDLARERYGATGSDGWRRLEPLLGRIRGVRTSMHRFNAVGVNADGHVVLQLRNNFWELKLPPNQPLKLGLRSDHQVKRFQQLESCSAPPGVGYTLRVATWPDGSRAWLDSRGLLHLRASHLDIPDMTIAMTNGTLAGWSGDGELFGPQYFLDDPGEVVSIEPSDRFRAHLTRFTELVQ